MSCTDIGLIVIGGLNTDIVALGAERLLSPGELTRSGRLLVGPGGKSCNLARMASPLIAPRKVAMIAKTCRDPFGLWKVPVDALRDAGVNTDFLKIEDFATAGKYPGVALIPVDRNGENQIYCVPGINDAFQPRDIADAAGLFPGTDSERMLALTLELPLETALYAVRKAFSAGMKVILDPGGIAEGEDYRELLASGIYLLAPNEHEARVLTGIEVEGMASAREAAAELFSKGVENIVLTHGERGAYVFSRGREKHVKAACSGEPLCADATGCGDQVTAVLCAEILRRKDVIEAGKTAVLAGTLQYQRPGIRPVTREELEAYLTQEDR